MAAANSTQIPPLSQLQALGQSVWLDDISRSILDGGELQRLIEEDGLSGLTSNPITFQEAIGQGDAYDGEIHTMVAEGHDARAIAEALCVADVRRALDLFRPVHDRTRGGDGFVGLEVFPVPAHDTGATIAEAKRLWALLDRPNAMIKIPGTPEGLPAIEEVLVAGINVDVTLLFSVEAYEAAAHAYLRALKRRLDAGLPIDHVASVASLFVSRIGAEADARIEAEIRRTTDASRRARLDALRGKVAPAHAKCIYAAFRRIFDGAEFAPFRARGGRPQRILWGSVIARDPMAPNTLYTAGLIGPDTISTMPRAALDSFRDHGRAEPTLLAGLSDAPGTIQQLADAGIPLKDVTDHLLRTVVDLFADAHRALIQAIRDKQAALLRERHLGAILSVGPYAEAVRATFDEFERIGAVGRIWDRDPTLWKTSPEYTGDIADSLGWLTVTEVVRPHAAALERFGEEIAGPGFSHVVVLGMGGSSLTAEVLRRTILPVAGHPELIVLDSTVPAAVHRVEGKIDPAHTLFIVASKSGTTPEPTALYAYFFDLVARIKGPNAGENFLAITDPDTLLHAQARRDTFRRIFLNPSDLGGGFSALSYFGMVPAALMGLDVSALLDRAEIAVRACRPEIPIRQNPGAQLGAALGALALRGRDKVTLVIPPPLEALGLWIEQLLAESTGKEGKGLVPVAGEPLGGPEVYGPDRVFVQIRLPDRPGVDGHPPLRALADAGHPVLDLVLAGPIDLGAAFFRWGFATALIGQRLDINPFDQPNVRESKDQTRALLKAFKETGALPEPEAIASSDGLTASADPGNRDRIRKALGAGEEDAAGRAALVAVLRAHFAAVGPGDYVALTQFFDEREGRDAAILAIRLLLRDRLRVATTTGYGPRFLHSTGQLHKGGADRGVFLQLTADDGEDIAIPGQPFGFATLVRAQALGDLQALAARHRRALRLHLGPDVDQGLAALFDLLEEAAPRP
ncbi:MAG TPA: bifunctional transaldolase/phosoglucose isomerase [Isosphaeraceae bacterium]|nr:bifunctional transaldolase/phosoglucose isomerase [Isosphaeraceae bacterium]